MAGANYEIVVRGRRGGPHTPWFEGLEVRPSGPNTPHAGWFADQAALQGLLRELGDLGLELAAVQRLPDPD